MSKWLQYLLLAGIVELAPAFAQDNQAPFSIKISTADSVFKAGSEVKIRLVFKNISDHEVQYERGLGTGVEPNGELFNDVKVRDAKGELVPETKYYRILRGKPDANTKVAKREKSGSAPPATVLPEPRPAITISSTGLMLKPGEYKEEDIVVSKLYDLSKPGEYAIAASRRLSDVATDPGSKIIAKSNTLVITISE